MRSARHDRGQQRGRAVLDRVPRSLARRGLRGVKLVISDAHEGLKAVIAKVLSATWQRCRVDFMRNALAYAGETQRRIVSACRHGVRTMQLPLASYDARSPTKPDRTCRSWQP